MSRSPVTVTAASFFTMSDFVILQLFSSKVVLENTVPVESSAHVARNIITAITTTYYSP
jgi:hypothetical protein